MEDKGYFKNACLCRIILASTLSLVIKSALFSWYREGTFFTGNLCPVFRQIEER